MAFFGAKDTRQEWFEIEDAQRKESIGILVKQNTPPDVFDVSAGPNLALHWAMTLQDTLLEDPRLQKKAAEKKVKIEGVGKTVRFSHETVLVGATAFLVAPDVIATAAHCIYDVLPQGRPNWNVKDHLKEFAFMLDYWYSQPGHIEVPFTSIYQIEEVIFHSTVVNLGPTGTWRGLDDFAFLHLAKAPENRPILPLSKVIPPVNSNVWSGGYSRCIPLKYKQGQRMKTFAEDRELTMSFAITNYPGDSGAPLLNDQREVVAIVSGTTRSAANVEGFTVSDHGWIIPMAVGSSPSADIAETPTDLCVYAYRVDAVRWLLDNTAKVTATFTFTAEDEDASAPSPEATLTVKSGAQQVTATLPAGHEGDLSLDCTAFIAGQAQGLLDLKSFTFVLNSPHQPDGAVLQWCQEINLTVSPPTPPATPQCLVRVYAGSPMEVKNNQVYEQKPQVSLPNQKTVPKPNT